mmetsp:Transcript_25217/g.37247  ORF Transcript_25217/g.37247 Transcript_25217/m.37247 type:complete len:114 (-) Transcript_25217:2014-2355(-)
MRRRQPSPKNKKKDKMVTTEGDYSTVQGDDVDPEDGNVPASFYGDKKSSGLRALFRSYNFRRRSLPCMVATFLLVGLTVSLTIAYRRGHLDEALQKSELLLGGILKKIILLLL